MTPCPACGKKPIVQKPQYNSQSKTSHVLYHYCDKVGVKAKGRNAVQVKRMWEAAIK